jgi:hypothetical protein
VRQTSTVDASSSRFFGFGGKMDVGEASVTVAGRLSPATLGDVVQVLRRMAAEAGASPATAMPAARDWDAEAEALRQQLTAVEERVASAKRRVHDKQKTCAVTERLAGVVALYLAPDASPEELAQRVAAEAPLLEKSKAFRMVREKVQATATPVVVAASVAGNAQWAVSQRVATALTEMREQLEKPEALEPQQLDGLPVVPAAAHCAALLAKLDKTERVQVQCGARVLLARRFAREPEIPLFAALHHNSLAALGPELSSAARAQLRGCAERVRGELRGHLEEAEPELERKDAGWKRAAAAQTRAMRRCAHGLGLLRRAWSEALPEERLAAELARLVDWLLEWLVQRVLRAGDLSATESEALGTSLAECLSLLATALGLPPDASDTQRRAAAPAWPRARRAAELLAGTPLASLEPRLASLRASFAPHELRLLLEAIYEDKPLRTSLLQKL